MGVLCALNCAMQPRRMDSPGRYDVGAEVVEVNVSERHSGGGNAPKRVLGAAQRGLRSGIAVTTVDRQRRDALQEQQHWHVAFDERRRLAQGLGQCLWHVEGQADDGDVPAVC